MQASDSDFKEVLTICKSKMAHLMTANFNTPSSLPEDNLSLENFSQEYKKRFPNSILFTGLNVSFQTSKNYNPDNLYYSSKVCYVQVEERTCSGALYPKPKKNTYTLCPICKPFSAKGNKPHMEKRQGRTYFFDICEPRFYDTLHSQFDHHMNHVHGIYKDGSTAPQPMLVLAEGDHRTYELNSLCPMAAKDKTHACCWLNKVNLKAIENPLKAYLRHYTAAHSRKSSVVKDNEVYSAEKNGYLYPLEPNDFRKTFNELRQQCDEVPRILYKDSPEECGLTFNEMDGTAFDGSDYLNTGPGEMEQPIGPFSFDNFPVNETIQSDAIPQDIQGQYDVTQYNASQYNPLSDPVEYEPMDVAPDSDIFNSASVQCNDYGTNPSHQLLDYDSFGTQPVQDPLSATMDTSFLDNPVQGSVSNVEIQSMYAEIEPASFEPMTQQEGENFYNDLLAQIVGFDS